MRFSATRTKTAGECMLQWKFKYVDQIPGRQHASASWGICIHAALDYYENHNHDLDGAIALYLDLWENPDKVGASPEVWAQRTTYTGLREKGQEILREYHDKQRWDGRRLIATEHKFLVPFGHHELTGFVDKLEIKRSGKGKDLLRIVDYKSGSWKPTQAELMADIQFTIYVYASMQPEFWTGNGPDFPGLFNGEALYEEFRELPRRAIWYHLRTSSEIDAGRRDDDDFMRLYRMVDEIEKSVRADIFVPSISGKACSVCDYAGGPCPVRIPTRAEVLDDEEAWV